MAVKACDCEAINKELIENIKPLMPDDTVLSGLSGIFKIMGDKTRIRLLWAIDNSEMCVGDLAYLLNMTKSAVSHQLAVLRKNNIVKCRRCGKEMYYTLDDDHINKLFEIGLEHINHKEL